MTATEFTLYGQLSDGFADWICHRARLLNLAGWVTDLDRGALTIVVTGPQALIDAMETACSLGPVDVLVDRIDARPTTLTAPPNGFSKR